MLLAAAVGPAAAVSTLAKRVEPGISAQIVNGKNIYLLAHANTRERARAAAEQVMLDPDIYTRYARSPGLRVPLHRLTPEYRVAVTESLFARDRPTAHGWNHYVTYADNSRDGGESLWRISEWFTGAGKNWKVIARYNGMNGRTSLRVGHRVLIPNHVLLRDYRAVDAPEPAPRVAAVPPLTAAARPARPPVPRRASELTYHEDALGAYARYRMKRGETLYSDVVTRFTDRVSYAMVMDAAKEIAGRSGIRDMTKIRSGQSVKIPMAILSAEYRSPADPARLDYERTRELARSYFNTRRHMNLGGITVVLDSGHGGTDPGAIGRGRTYEDEVCYDVAVRVRRILETETGAEVVMLVQDRSQKWNVADVSRFVNDKDEVLLTTPKYTMTDAKVAVNLRWYLANSIYRRALANGTDPDDVIFTSFHADALHPALYGAMVYIPGARYTAGTNGRSGRVYSRRAEVREQQYVRISWKNRVRMEGRSRNFARVLINQFRRAGIPVHANKPIRDVIHRSRRKKFVPAVIRQNLIPNKVLVELVNLKNERDTRRIRDPAFRENFARAYVNALIEYYGGKPAPRVAARPVNSTTRRNGLAGE